MTRGRSYALKLGLELILARISRGRLRAWTGERHSARRGDGSRRTTNRCRKTGLALLFSSSASHAGRLLLGTSRRHFAAWLDKLGVEVDYLGLWDTVDATIGLDVAADCPRNVKKARHAVSRDETRKFFQYVPLKGDKGQVVEMLFPGSHSDVGGLYDDNHLVADLALAWIAAGAKREGLRFRRTARLSQKLDATAVVLHDPHGESSNLWGAFDRVRRNLPRIRLHFACKGL